MKNEMQFLINDLLAQRGVLAYSKLPVKPAYVFMSVGTYIKLKDYVNKQEMFKISNPLGTEYFYGMKIVIADLPDMKFVLGTEGV